MSGRVRGALRSLRPNVPAGVLTATAVSTAVFSATPFLIPAIAADRDLSVGLVGVISTAQLGGFVVASGLAPRWLRPRRRVMVLAIAVGMVSNLLSGLSPWFSMLVAMRALSGVSLGLIAWIGWTEVFGDDDRVGDMAVIGPVVGTVASPILAAFLDAAGADWLYFGLAALHVVPLLFIRAMRLDAAKRVTRERHRPTRAAVAILVALCLLTFGGSAMFVFAGAVGRNEVGLSSFTMSLVFAANAFVGIPSARWRGARPLTGCWMLITGVCAIAVGAWHSQPVYVIAMLAWGFAFWMGIPGAFSLLAERSKYPSERAGDAQSMMAVGRVVGPLVGGVLYEVSPATLGVVAGGVMIAAAVFLLYVEWRIRPHVYEPFVIARGSASAANR